MLYTQILSRTADGAGNSSSLLFIYKNKGDWQRALDKELGQQTSRKYIYKKWRKK
jgi:hypothetical protein